MVTKTAFQQMLPDVLDQFFRSSRNTVSEEKKKTIDFMLNTQLIKEYQEKPETADEKETKLYQIVQMNLGLVMNLVGNYAKIIKRTCMDIEDVISLGTIGLLESIKKFDPDRGCQFSTFATWRIRQMITRGIADEARLIRFPAHIHEQVMSVKKAERLFEHTYGFVDIKRICEILEMGVDDYWKIKRIIYQMDKPLSIDAMIGNDRTSNLQDLLPLNGTIEPTATPPLHTLPLEEVLEKKELQNKIKHMLNSLKPRDAEIIRLRFGIGDYEPHTLSEIAKLYHVSHQSIHQLEVKIMKRFK
ncbi:sigma-70 family RNA polymerase sigma factor [Sporolactobacillus kofuensis]|uniref:Sigma-70 family RNA polymerase sigma factor n=1 Tax=Sporolactobacillus kofuensis TaxID=269672 RepID=A0ABW1WFK9_9BACL|nr:sigma-70 family RNA polymerase sigma factor [Sporolactobacillus kofuensis]MCO7174797.1 sigma-70 family RNA polymerase sigma factor [Sporolactobacillus kofuensis]